VKNACRALNGEPHGKEEMRGKKKKRTEVKKQARIKWSLTIIVKGASKKKNGRQSVEAMS